MLSPKLSRDYSIHVQGRLLEQQVKAAAEGQLRSAGWLPSGALAGTSGKLRGERGASWKWSGNLHKLSSEKAANNTTGKWFGKTAGIPLQEPRESLHDRQLRSVSLKNSFKKMRAGLLFIAAAVLIAGIVAAFLLKKPSLDFDPFVGRALDPPVTIPPFSLIDHRGKEFGNENLAGHWTLAFFGFTFCPDVCPTALNEIAAVYKQMGSMPGEGLAPEFIFFSVDPFRDTPEELGKYVGHFNKGFVGVTGKPEIISKLVADLGLYYAYTDPDDDHVLDGVLHRPAMDYYGVIHSSRLLFISPQAELVAMMSPPFTFANVMEFLNTLRKHHGE